MSPYEFAAASRFLGMWRALSQAGSFVAPMLVGVVTGLASFHDALLLVVAFGIFGLVWVLFVLIETKEADGPWERAGRAGAEEDEDDESGPLLAVEMMQVQDEGDSCPGSSSDRESEEGV